MEFNKDLPSLTVYLFSLLIFVALLFLIEKHPRGGRK